MDPYFLLTRCIYRINIWSSFEFCLVFEWFRQRLLRLCLPQLRYETAVMLLDFCNIVNIIRMRTIHCSNLILQGCCFWHSVENIIFPLYGWSLYIFFYHLNDFLVFFFGETFLLKNFISQERASPKHSLLHARSKSSLFRSRSLIVSESLLMSDSVKCTADEVWAKIKGILILNSGEQLYSNSLTRQGRRPFFDLHVKLLF